MMTKSEPSAGGEHEGRVLAPYASYGALSRGRLYSEDACPTRSPFQRDRDRIVHSTAFRRLNHKTQVFIYHEGDHFRSRLTHSIEVAQIARAIARTLKLDEGLTEAIALAHDLGHPPFGHAGERALDEAMTDYGGFDHNGQSLRVVTMLERKYAAFDGLNLTWEALEGLAKHNGPVLTPDADKGIARALKAYNDVQDLELASWPSAEAQVAAIADDIAYNNHDIDDGFRAGSYLLEDLGRVDVTGGIIGEVHALHPQLEASRVIYEINRRLITRMIEDVVDEATTRLDALAPSCVDDIRGAEASVVTFSAEMTSACDELRAFLLERVYRENRILRVMEGAGQIVRDLFTHFMNHTDAMPENWQKGVERANEREQAAQVCDFIAGMTDRYAVREHTRLFDHTPELR
jgi:dGTPase